MRVLVAMSGGVDSSVAAARLVEQGHDVIGATMKLFCYGDSVPDRPCCSLDSITDGHYAVARDGGLFRGQDRQKDQSYFLWGIDRAVVRRMLTPIGALTKAETRAAARKLGLVTAEKAESVEICFVPDDDYVAVLERHLPADAPALIPGPLVTTRGEVIGAHDGFARYTVGQRRGLPGGSSEPLYVERTRYK